MIGQAWFEMAEFRRRKFGPSVWIPLRAVQPICEEGKRGHLGFKEDFFGAGSLAVPVELKDKAGKLGWSDVGISHEHRACVDEGRYIPSDVYEYSRGEQIGSLHRQRARSEVRSNRLRRYLQRYALQGTHALRLRR